MWDHKSSFAILKAVEYQQNWTDGFIILFCKPLEIFLWKIISNEPQENEYSVYLLQRGKVQNEKQNTTNLFSLSLRSSIGSKPVGLATGAKRFCFCCIVIMAWTEGGGG